MAIEFRGIEVESFVDYCRKTKPDDDVLNYVEEFIMAWHGSDGWDLELDEALGVSEEDYAKFMGDHEFILQAIRS